MSWVGWIVVVVLAMFGIGLMPLGRSDADLPLRLVVTRAIFAWFLIALVLLILYSIGATS